MDHLIQNVREDLYHPLAGLHTFRLLILEPGQTPSPISIRLQAFERATAPAYDAISYVWGDPTQTVVVSCDGKPLQITFNLYWALVRIRDVSYEKVLWADAICINQADLEERSNQVTFMASLYEHAKVVYIFMGGAEDGSEFQVQTVIDDAKTLRNGGQLPVLQDGHPLTNDGRWYALAVLTENPWFTRAWVVQESALAKHPIVLYGRAEFEYRDLVQILGWLNTSSWAIQFGVSSLLIHLQWADWRQNAYNPAYEFVDLLSHAALLDCTDPRDKVYAFLGHQLAYSLMGNPLLRPDYQKTSGEVYLELSKALIQQSGLRVLTTVEHTQDTIDDTSPSWVTRWDVQLVRNDIFKVPSTQFRASAGLTTNPAVIAGENLVLQGVVLDTVRESFTIHASELGIEFENNSTGECLKLWTVLEELHRASDSPSPYNDRIGAFCATLSIGGSIIEATLKRWATCLAVTLRNEGQSATSTHSQEQQHEVLVFISELRAYCENRSFAITGKGFYGLVPLLTKPGDVSCVLVGVDVPFILRPHAASKFKLLGESYVHGVMEGQCTGMLERKEVFEQIVVIC